MKRQVPNRTGFGVWILAAVVGGGLSTVVSGQEKDAKAPSKDSACTKCHAPIERVLQRKNKHAAVEMGCDTCHSDHRSATATAKKEHYLTEDQPGLCLTCHDAKDKQIAAAHKGQPFDKAACSGCHDPHASDGAKLMPAHAHGPFGSRQCEGCHEAPAADGKVVLTAKTASGLCFTCHEDFKNRFDKAPHKHSLLSGDADSCKDCHTPHASNRQSFLKKDRPQLCGDCHSEVTASKKFVHEPVKSSCTLCHDPHSSNSKSNLYATGNDLCLGCHGLKGSEIVSAKATVQLFGGRVQIAPGSFEDLKFLELSPDGKLGHPFPAHPVRADAKGSRPEITCITCHLPHAANGSRQFLITESSNSAKLCVRCHK